MFIWAPGITTSLTAFQAPYRDTCHVALERLAKLVSPKKSVDLWTGIFALLEAGNERSDQKNLQQYLHCDNTDDAKGVTWKAKFLEATTPAKKRPGGSKDEAIALPDMI
ncbi:hypothetical protein ACA910_014018 [Epithemia clementina (nom. ined.)]